MIGTVLGELFLFDAVILQKTILIADCLCNIVQHSIESFVFRGWHVQFFNRYTSDMSREVEKDSRILCQGRHQMTEKSDVAKRS